MPSVYAYDSNWSLGDAPSCCFMMFLYFAAAGHNLYAKSAYIYLQTMQRLPESHPEIHRNFLQGNHVIDRVIGSEQDYLQTWSLNKYLASKQAVGLTSSGGFSEVQRLVWLLSMPACADINDRYRQIGNGYGDL